MTQRVPRRIAARVDYTDVRKELTYAEVEQACHDAQEHKVASIVVPSALVPLAVECLADADVAVGCYIAYPFGTQSTRVKAREAEAAVAQGATELELVPHHGTLRAGRWTEIEGELRTVRTAAGNALLKLAVELSYLADDELATIARIAAEAGYRLLSNTAGFRTVSTRPETEAAATPEAVARILRAGGGIRPKATGGIRAAAEVVRLLDAGAERVTLHAAPSALRRLAKQFEEAQ